MFCSNCGKDLTENEMFCGNCGTKNEVKAAKDMAPPSHTIYTPDSSTPQAPSYVESGQPMAQAPVQSGIGYGGPNQFLLPQTRDFWMWLILGICTCGIGAIVYLYHNFNDTRKLEVAVRMRGGGGQFHMNHTSDPWVGVIAYFVCSPVATIMKYNNLNNFINYYGDAIRDPRPATASKVIGVWIGAFFSFIFGILILPLLLLAFGLIFYAIYLEKEWQDVLNFHISRAWQTA